MFVNKLIRLRPTIGFGVISTRHGVFRLICVSGLQAREDTWNKMTPNARTQFLWPDPGLPRGKDNTLYEQVLDP